MADIFLSYSRKDRAVAAALAEILPRFGWTLYWDRQLLAGEVYDEVLEREIDAARCVVVLWSAHSIASQWVRNEADEGASRNVMVSVRIDDVKVPLAFRRIQAADLVGWTGGPDDPRLGELQLAIARLLGSEHAAPAEASLAAAAGAQAAGPAHQEAAPLAPAQPPSHQRPAWPQGRPSEQWLSGLKRDLAGYVGPVAALVVNRALRDSGSLADLVERVAAEIPSESDRGEFLAARRMAGAPDAPQARRDAPAALPHAAPERPPTETLPESLRRESPAAANHAARAAALGSPARKASVERPTAPVAGSSRQRRLLWLLGAAVALAGAAWLVRLAGSKQTPGELRVSPARIDWTSGAGPGAGFTSTIRIEGGQFAFEAISTNGWLEVWPDRGTAPASVTVALKGSPSGSRDGEVVIRGAGGAMQAIPVRLRVAAAPMPPLSISPAALSLSSQESTVPLNVGSGGAPQNFSARVTRGGEWLSVKPAAGVTPAAISVSYRQPPAGLAAGSYKGELLLDSLAGQVSVPVSLNIRAAALRKPAPVLMGGPEMESTLIHKVVPVYPKVAIEARVQGAVEFRAVIAADGTVERLNLVRGHPLLVKAAEEAVEQFRYKPVLLNGTPVEVTTNIIINFVLKR